MTEIGGRRLENGAPVLIIAEAGVNHNGSRDDAFRLVDAAKACGADAIKFQMFKAELLASARAEKARYQQGTASPGSSQLEMLRALELNAGIFADLAGYAAAQGLMFLATPFDDESLGELNSLNPLAIKIGSGDVTNLPFLKRAAALGRPLVISTGMSTLSEVGDAVEAIESTGNRHLVLLQCTSAYPTPSDQVNLLGMRTLADAFGYPVGFSDHTTGTTAGIAAVALGARVIEKHLTLDRTMAGPDHSASLDPASLANFVQQLRETERILGSARKTPSAVEMENRRLGRKGLVAARRLPAGAVLTSDMIAAKRPADGLPPSAAADLVGKVTLRTLEKDEPIHFGDAGRAT